MSGGSPMRSGSQGSSRTFQSTGLRPAAATRTRTSVGAGSGRVTSSSSRTSGPPCSRITTAFMGAQYPWDAQLRRLREPRSDPRSSSPGRSPPFLLREKEGGACPPPAFPEKQLPPRAPDPAAARRQVFGAGEGGTLLEEGEGPP